MEIAKLLERIGLSGKQSKIYLSLIEHGASTVSDISKFTEIHRPLVYKEIPKLQEAGLLSVANKGKRTLYVAESPQKLEAIFRETWDELKGALDELQQTFNARGNKPILKFFEGRGAITKILSDVVHSLKHGDVFYRYSSVKKVNSVDKYLPKDYREIRDKKKLERFVIATEEYIKQKKKRMERAIKAIPETSHLFDHNVSMIIYGKKISYIDYNTKSAFIIENEDVAKFHMSLFKTLYSKL